MLATATVDPRERSRPRNNETPWKAGEPAPGRYGKATIAANTTIRTRMMLKVGCAQSG